MKRLVKFLSIVAIFLSILNASRPDPLDVLRGHHIPRSTSHKKAQTTQKRTTRKKRYTQRIQKKRVYRKRVYKKRALVSRKKRGTNYRSRGRRMARIKKEYLGPVKNIKLNQVNYEVYQQHKLTGNAYLDMKAIDGPMPQEYATLYLKSKTLNNPTKPYLKIIIDKSKQRMYVYKDFKHIYTFKVSTGKAGHITPNGVFKPYSVEAMHYSKKYYNSPMPWSVFFNGGVAIHGTASLSRLGSPASHGCVRTYPRSAKRIYNLVRKYGKSNTTIIVRD
jgi:lipoprotein-anchoring transpeptidase ErfK/SrfK